MPNNPKNNEDKKTLVYDTYVQMLIYRYIPILKTISLIF